MSNNAGIILAVSNYQNPDDCLPGCVQDAQIMKTLLNATSKYSEILVVNEDTDSIKVKDKLSEFISSNKSKIFDEIFFYYTGHGDFRDEEFYYILSDFDESKYRQTSLSNSELDTFLKQLSPKLTIKVVDSCHSGVKYIKKYDTFRKFLENSKNEFNMCYFMFSSMRDQYSYQSKIISDFTQSFVQSISSFESEKIRYKHILDFISDKFEKNPDQKPFFVNQANFTEIFCDVSDELKETIAKEMENIVDNKPDYSKNKELSLVDLVKKDSERYCSEEEAIEKINLIKDIVQNYKYSSDILSLYEIQNTFEQDYKSISSHNKIIGKWLEENEHDYFAKTVYEKVLIHNLNEAYIFANISKMLTPYKDQEYETVIKGYQITTELPFYIVKIDAKPEYKSIKWCDCKIAFAFSQVAIRFFYYFANFKLKNWTEYSHEYTANWQTLEVELKNKEKLKEAIHNILSKFDSFILDPLQAKYILTVESNKVKEDSHEE